MSNSRFSLIILLWMGPDNNYKLTFTYFCVSHSYSTQLLTTDCNVNISTVLLDAISLSTTTASSSSSPGWTIVGMVDRVHVT